MGGGHRSGMTCDRGEHDGYRVSRLSSISNRNSLRIHTLNGMRDIAGGSASRVPLGDAPLPVDRIARLTARAQRSTNSEQPRSGISNRLLEEGTR